MLLGRLADLAGWRERTFQIAPSSLSTLRALVAQQDAALGAALQGPGVRAAVDRALVAGDPTIRPGAEVAFLPPMSGG